MKKSRLIKSNVYYDGPIRRGFLSLYKEVSVRTYVEVECCTTRDSYNRLKGKTSISNVIVMKMFVHNIESDKI